MTILRFFAAPDDGSLVGQAIAALKPFAAELDGYADDLPDCTTLQEPTLTLGDLRLARKILTNLTNRGR